MPPAGCPLGEQPRHRGSGCSGRARLPAGSRSVTSTRGCGSLPRVLGRGGVTARGARGDTQASLGVVLSCWPCCIPLLLGPAASLPIQLFPSCHRSWLRAQTRVTPPPLCPCSRLYFRSLSLVPTSVSPPQPPREVLLKLRPSRDSSAGDKSTGPRTFPSPRRRRKTQKNPPKPTR